MYHGCTMTCWERVSSVSTVLKFHLLAPLETCSPKDNTCFLYSCMIRRKEEDQRSCFMLIESVDPNPGAMSAPHICWSSSQQDKPESLSAPRSHPNPALPLHDSSNKPLVTSPCLCIRVADEMLMMCFFFSSVPMLFIKRFHLQIWDTLFASKCAC